MLLRGARWFSETDLTVSVVFSEHILSTPTTFSGMGFWRRDLGSAVSPDDLSELDCDVAWWSYHGPQTS